MKDPVLLRNFVIFSLVLALCVLGLGYHTFQSSASIRRSDLVVSHSQEVIFEAQDLIQTINNVVSFQRNIVILKDPDTTRYEKTKQAFSRQVGQLRQLTADNSVHASRMLEIEHLSLRLKDLLDQKVSQYRNASSIPTMTDYQEIVQVRDDMFRLTRDILNEEYRLLKQRERNVSKTISNYQMTLFIGGVIAAMILLIFNWYLLQAQTRNSQIEATLRDSEERLRLAIRGSNDGIFDWNFQTKQIYWSPQYKAMLGYEDEEIRGDEETFRKLLHPEDSTAFWESFNNYINGSLSEFACVFRMIHKSGRSVWINGRGKALFDENGRPLRFIGAHTDISYIKEHERQLKEERDRAERASLAKGEFLAHMSHEIRTPLTAVSGIAEIFSQTENTLEENHRKLVRTLKTSTETLKELITDILDFSKIESGEVELHNQKFTLGELFQQVISIMTVKAAEKDLEFAFDFNEVKNTSFLGDKQRIRQILINLVGNAIKFTESGSVSVRASIEPIAESHILRVDVIDTGIGIAPESLPVIFEKFRQADASVSRRYGGTGLGLPISKSLAEIMGGTIKVKSAPGEGSTFTLILPFTAMSDRETLDVNDVIRVQKLNDRLRAAIGEKRKVLLVEDYEGNVVVLSYILNSLNCAYDVAHTGLEAVQMWKDRHYDLILMDVQMPEMDGLTASRTIRKMELEQNVRRTPIIGLTAHALVADKAKCIDAGMDDYLSKPIVEADLKAAILRLLEKQPGPENQAA